MNNEADSRQRRDLVAQHFARVREAQVKVMIGFADQPDRPDDPRCKRWLATQERLMAELHARMDALTALRARMVE